MKLHRITINSGQEVLETLSRELHKKNISSGVIVSVIGAVDECSISTMPKEDAKKDIIQEYYEPLELMGSGEILKGKPHIHCTLGREGNRAIMGHLHEKLVRVGVYYF